MDKKNFTVVVIEDDRAINSQIADFLSLHYKKIYSFTNYQDAEFEVPIIQPDIILLDIFLDYFNGLDLVEHFRQQGLKVPIIMMITYNDTKLVVRALRLGADDYIIKPFDLEHLVEIIDKSLKNYDIRRQVSILEERLKEELPSEIIGNSEGVLKALEMSKIVAGTDTTVLIYGETGTGKELFSKFIHNNSLRANGPFVTLNCGAIPRELAENELFGYERGAFTGAIEKIKQGRFEQAHRGTILLDEISELSLELQVKLLRVLQEKKYYRLGGQKEITVDVRVIASTNRNLEKLVEEGKFRDDLYYRLNVARINLPPLRERNDDIMLLATSFVNEFNKKFGKKITGFDEKAIEMLYKYKWKGNIRELRNVIERVVLLETNSIISVGSLHFLNPISEIQDKGFSGDSEAKQLVRLPKDGVSMIKVIKDLIEQTLKLTNGNKTKAAEILEISLAQLEYRIEQLNIRI